MFEEKIKLQVDERKINGAWWYGYQALKKVKIVGPKSLLIKVGCRKYA